MNNNKLEQLEAYLGEEETTTLIETIEMLEDKMENQQDQVAKDFYYKISGAIQELQQAVYEAKNFYE
jgi:transcription elongation GreA/GreB family factor